MKAILSGERPQLLAAYLEKELPASEAAALEVELSESGEARRQLEQLRSIRDALAGGGEDFESVELLPKLREKIRSGPLVEPRPKPFLFERFVGWQRWVPAAAAVLLLILVPAYLGAPLVVGALDAPSQEFREKSASPGLASDRWTGFQAYRVRARVAERLGEELSREDELSFSYTNQGTKPFAHLMIFALDSAGEVRWFYPAYQQPGANPVSIAIEKGAARVVLPELIQHDFAPGPLAIHALFTNEPLRVLEVEAWLNQGQRANLTERVSGAVEQVLTTRVKP